MASERRLAAWLLLVAGLLAAPSARAEQSESQKEAARTLMAEARELRDRKDLLGALARFQAADAIMNVPTTGFEVARTEADLLQLVEARATLRRVLAIAEQPDDPEPFRVARDKARLLDAELAERLGAVKVVLRGLSAGSATVMVDEDRVPSSLLELPFRVNPGHHRVLVVVAGREQRREVDVPERGTVAVTFELEAAPGAGAVEAPPAAPQPPATTDAGPRRPIPKLVYVGGGMAVAGVLAGSVSGLLALGKKHDAQDGCRNNQCPPSSWDDLDASRRFAAISTVSFIVAGAGAGLAIGGLVLDKKRETAAASLRLAPLPGGLSVDGRF